MIRRGGPCRSRPAIAGEPGITCAYNNRRHGGAPWLSPARRSVSPYGITCRNPLPDKEVGVSVPPKYRCSGGDGCHVNNIVIIVICPSTYAKRYGRCLRRGTPRTTLLSRHGSTVCGPAAPEGRLVEGAHVRVVVACEVFGRGDVVAGGIPLSFAYPPSDACAVRYRPTLRMPPRRKVRSSGKMSLPARMASRMANVGWPRRSRLPSDRSTRCIPRTL